MKQIIKIAGLLMFCVCVAFASLYVNMCNANTREIHELILQEKTKYDDLQILSEVVIGENLYYAFSTPVSDGIAEFHRQKNGSYKWWSHAWISKGGVLGDTAFVNRDYYRLYLYNNDEAVSLKVRIEFNDGSTTIDEYDVSENKLVYFKTNDANKIELKYYDKNGKEIWYE